MSVNEYQVELENVIKELNSLELKLNNPNINPNELVLLLENYNKLIERKDILLEQKGCTCE